MAGGKTVNGIKLLKNQKKFIKRIKERKIRNKKSENRLFSLFVLNKNEEKLSINAAKRKSELRQTNLREQSQQGAFTGTISCREVHPQHL